MSLIRIDASRLAFLESVGHNSIVVCCGLFTRHSCFVSCFKKQIAFLTHIVPIKDFSVQLDGVFSIADEEIERSCQWKKLRMRSRADQAVAVVLRNNSPRLGCDLYNDTSLDSSCSKFVQDRFSGNPRNIGYFYASGINERRCLRQQK